MRHTVAVPLLSSIIILLGGPSAAAPLSNVEEPCQPQTVCVDGLSPCGVRYGGYVWLWTLAFRATTSSNNRDTSARCYDVCEPSAKPLPPPCPATVPGQVLPVANTKTRPPVVTDTKIRPPAVTKTKIRVTQPPITKTVGNALALTPSITTSTKHRTPAPISSRDSSSSSNSCDSTVTVCWDGINECGMMYGGYVLPFHSFSFSFSFYTAPVEGAHHFEQGFF